MSRYLIVPFALLLGCSSISTRTEPGPSALVAYARAWEPPGMENGPPKLPTPPPEVVRELEGASMDDAYMKSVTLVMLKLYRSHMECCHQSYELRTSATEYPVTNPILIAFARMARMNEDGYRHEFVSSGIVLDWFKLHHHYLRDPDLRSEYDRIRKVEERIRNSLRGKK